MPTRGKQRSGRPDTRRPKQKPLGTASKFTEVLRNARQAGAKRVDVRITHVEKLKWTVEVTDDGAGATDASAFCEPGQSGWTTPAEARLSNGLGLIACCGQVGMTVRTRTGNRPGEAWKAVFDTEAMQSGQAPPKEEPDELTPKAPGTVLTFGVQAGWPTIRESVAIVAREMLPVEVTLNGEKLEQEPFIHEPLYERKWKNFRLAVCRENASRRTTDVLIGRTAVTGPLAKLRGPDGVWVARLEAADEPNGLELKTVRRNQRVELQSSAATRELLREARRTLCLAFAQPGVRRRVYTETRESARRLGIEIEPEPAELEYWRVPEEEAHGSGIPRSGDLLVKPDEMPSEDMQTAMLGRALAVNGQARRVFVPDDLFDGQEWYDGLPRITRVQCMITGQRGERITLEDASALGLRGGRCPETLELELRTEDGKIARTLPTDVAITEDRTVVGGLKTVVTRDSTITTAELQAVLQDVHGPWYDDGDTQDKREWEENLEFQAIEALEGRDQAELDALLKGAARSLNSTLRQHLEQESGWEVRWSRSGKTNTAELVHERSGTRVRRVLREK